MRKTIANIFDMLIIGFHHNYITYIIMGILLIPIIFILVGFIGIKESYFENNDLSFKRYKESRTQYYPIKK